MLIDLADATPETSGGKAAPLARLIRAGLPVPPGFVVPIQVYDEAITSYRGDAEGAGPIAKQPHLSSALLDEIAVQLHRITGPSAGFVVVRSSATSEDAAGCTAAGQHDTVLAVRGTHDVAQAVRRCWASLWSARAVEYRRHGHLPAYPPTMAVLVQRMVDADLAGVMFTGATTRIEASWGLGDSVVSGTVTPDSWAVSEGTVLDRRIGDKATRVDRVGSQVGRREVAPEDRSRLCLSDEDLLALARVGRQIEELLGGPQDIEWAIAGGRTWVLQARPVTAGLPATHATRGAVPVGEGVLRGIPGSPGRATGRARLVRGPGDFTTVQPGDILVCRTTDPGWTPLLGVVAAVVTETGGVLSHAAIVARELGIPAVLAVGNVMSALPQDCAVDVHGDNGWVAWMR